MCNAFYFIYRVDGGPITYKILDNIFQVVNAGTGRIRNQTNFIRDDPKYKEGPEDNPFFPR